MPDDFIPEEDGECWEDDDEEDAEHGVCEHCGGEYWDGGSNCTCQNEYAPSETWDEWQARYDAEERTVGGWLLHRWWRLCHTVKHLPGNVYWAVRNFIQRGRRGWADEDVWRLGEYVCRVTAAMLRELAETTDGFPPDVSYEEWQAILRKMADGYEAGAQLFSENLWDGDVYPLLEKFGAGLDLMREWLPALLD